MQKIQKKKADQRIFELNELNELLTSCTNDKEDTISQVNELKTEISILKLEQGKILL